MPNHTTTIDFHVNRGDEEVILSIIGRVSLGMPGKTYGEPDDCYPDEGDEVWIDTILLDNKPWSGELTDEETYEAEEMLLNAVVDSVSEQDYDEYEDNDWYDDDTDYDDMDDYYEEDVDEEEPEWDEP